MTGTADGSKSSLIICKYSRYSKPIPIPSIFMSHLGSTFMDGELWFGRSCNTKLQEMRENTNMWEIACFCVYDLPSHQMSSQPFEKRLRHLVEGRLANDFVISYCFYEIGIDYIDGDIIRALAIVSGRGVLLRTSGSLYGGGRSHSLLQLEAPKTDALVLSIMPPLCTLMLQNRAVVQALLQVNTVQVGDIVQFSCGSFINDTPTEVVIREVRNDTEWNPEFSNEVLPFIVQGVEGRSGIQDDLKPQKPRGHWTENEGANIRLFFDNFASTKGLDPLLPESWYSFSLSDIYSAENGYSVYSHYNSLRRALIDVYPKVTFDPSKWKRVSRTYWNPSNNRKAFFDAYAYKKGFDPLVPENWYSISKTEVTLEHKGSSVLAKHGYSVVKALLSIYPSIGLNESKFTIMTKRYWNSRTNRKYFFDTFATQQGADPLVASSWYSIRRKQILQRKGGKYLLSKFTSLFHALLDSYPDIGLKKAKFSRT